MGAQGRGVKTACTAFLSQGALGVWFAAQGEFPFAECSSQKLVMCRGCDGGSALSGRAGSGGMAGTWAQKAFARPILFPHEGVPMGSVIRVPETPSKAAGPRDPGAAQPRIALWRAQGLGGKTACTAFLSQGELGVWFAARGEFPFAECSSQKLVLGRSCHGSSALSGRAGSGGMAVVWAQKAFARPILLPHEGEPVGSVIRVPESPSKAAGPRDPGAAQPRFALWRAEGRGKNNLC